MENNKHLIELLAWNSPAKMRVDNRIIIENIKYLISPSKKKRRNKKIILKLSLNITKIA